MKKNVKIIASFQTWYASLKKMRQYGSRPAKGAVAAALIVLEHLRSNCRLSLQDHLADGGAQIAGLNLPSLRKVLDRFGEQREFPSEGGRTNRGNNKVAASLLSSLAESGFGEIPEQDRLKLLDQMQKFLVESLAAYYKLEGIHFNFNIRKPARMIISEILANAEGRSQSGPVAQHLVGAKLALRFPDKNIENNPYSAPDKQSGRAGDFLIGKTAFHVTVAPNRGHTQKCQKNLKDGLSAFLLVCDAKLATGNTLLEMEGLEDKVVVESVESFVGQNLSELAEFTPEKGAVKLGELLREYNRRIKDAETDASLLILLPAGVESVAE